MPLTLCTDEIVLSGIAGRLPESANVEEFGQNLFNGVDMVTENRQRWAPGFLGLPPRNGRVLELDKFDGRFFGVHTKQSHAMDPQLRMLFELTFEAIMDAGMNPQELRGSRTGVYIGVSGSETETFLSFHPDLINGYVSPGCHRSMFANRISYAFDFHGPSYPVDTACSSSMVALENAISAIRLGKCDAAIVGGSNLVLHPYTSLHGLKLGMFSLDGKCKSFDISGDGYVRSEGVAVIFIQKKKLARRAYATILNVRNNTDGFKDKGVTFPSGKMQNELLRETYAEAGVDPSSLTYFEAHGTGTKAGDPQELNSVVDFCSGRTTPLLIGSVKSNAGHLEPVAGLASIAKMVVSMQAGAIPGNLHYRIPNPEIAGLQDGRLKVVTENTKWDGGIFGINSFGWGGANVHAIFQSFPKREGREEKLDLEKDLPYLVPFSGRTAESIEYAFEKLSGMEDQREIVGLLHQIGKNNIVGHEFRGYKILDGTQETKTQETNITKKVQTWFIFSGMGSQAGVKSLLKIKPFRESIEKSTQILKKKHNYDLIRTLTSSEPAVFENVTNSFLTIVSVQIALVDVLSQLGVKPDGIIGHSVGEVSCAYADGCLTQEEAILLAYWRGQAMLETSCPAGAMAAVGLSWQEAKSRCPDGVYPACQNTHDGVTISGEPAAVKAFVAKLKEDGVFAREVATSGFAFHSKYINPAADFLRQKLEALLPGPPKVRSDRWISTSNTSDKYCSVDYQINNLVSPVLFADAMDLIPESSVVIELAPHALLQALLRRALPSSCTRVGLTKKDAPDGVLHFMEALGSLYLGGLNLEFDALYKPVQFPVSLTTPMIHPLIKWDHSVSWDVASFNKPHKAVGETIIEVSVGNEEYSFLEDHMIDGRNICPVMMYMYAAWKALAILNETSVNQLPVEFQDVEFHRPILLSKENTLRFYVQIFSATGRFEIEESDSLLASGTIRKLEPEKCEALSDVGEDAITGTGMTREALYKEMKLRGYEYKPRFMGVKSQDFNGKWARIEWTNNWVAFLDSMLHTMILTHRNRDLDLPAAILRLAIDPVAFQQAYDNNGSYMTEGMPAVSEKSLGTLKCPGVELRGMRTSRGTKRPLHQKLPMLNNFEFEPYLDAGKERPDIHGVTFVIDTVLDNSKTLTVELVEVLDKEEDSIINYLKEIDSFRVEYKLERACFITNCREDWTEEKTKEGAVVHAVETHAEAFEKMQIQAKDVIVIHTEKDLPAAAPQVPVEGFLILISKELMTKETLEAYPYLRLTSVKRITGKFIHLLRKVDDVLDSIPTYHTILLSNSDYAWVEEVREALIRASVDIDYPKILLVSTGEMHSGVVALVKCLRKEPGGHSLRYIFVKSDSFEVSLSTPSPQLRKILEDDLVHNVISESGAHGFYAHHEYLPDKEVEGNEKGTFYLDTGAEGETSFRWHQAPPLCLNPTCKEEHRKIETSHAVLNLGELLLSTGKIGRNLIVDSENPVEVTGFEFSGVDSDGKRFIGITERSGLSTTICADKDDFLIELPSKVSLADGATMPMAYSTAIYALLVRGGLREGETVLIHNGSSPVGQAAIPLAIHFKCNVFTTVFSEDQRKFLKTKFPKLADSNILPADSFEKKLLSFTKGHGCTAILNTLSDEGLLASIRCIAQNGRFLDISRAESPMGMSVFSKNFTYHRIKYDGLSDRRNPERQVVAEKFQELLQSGVLQPISSKVFNHSEIEPAFKYLSSETNYGKVLLNLSGGEQKFSGLRHTYFNPEHVYILAGGLGDTGLEMADWMFARGAKKLVLANRSGVSNTYQSYHLRNWRESGATVEVPQVDITSIAQVRDLFKLARSLGPIGGIFNLSMVLRDNFLESMSLDDFVLVARPKILGTQNLDLVSREAEVCPDLVYFVLFSSVTSARGNAGQANYGFGNSAAEAMIESRLRDGFPACGLQFGPIADVGYVEYGMGGASAERVIVGTHPQKIKSVLATLDILLQDPTGIKTSVVIANRNTKVGAGKISLLEALGNVMGVPDSGKLDLGATLGELGMDSLMAVEMKQMMERDYGLFLSIQEMRIHTLGNLIKLTERH